MNNQLELNDLLEREYDLIKSGAIRDVERLSNLKARLLEALALSDVERVELDRLQQKARRNSALLGAMSEGIKDALQQVRETRSMIDQATYQKTGAKTRLAKSSPNLERKL